MRWLLLAAGAALAACGAGQPRPPMSDGERLYTAKCTGCHTYERREYQPEQWRKAVDEMQHEKKVTLTGEQRAVILAWLAEGAGANK